MPGLLRQINTTVWLRLTRKTPKKVVRLRKLTAKLSFFKNKAPPSQKNGKKNELNDDWTASCF